MFLSSLWELLAILGLQVVSLKLRLKKWSRFDWRAEIQYRNTQIFRGQAKSTFHIYEQRLPWCLLVVQLSLSWLHSDIALLLSSEILLRSSVFIPPPGPPPPPHMLKCQIMKVTHVQFLTTNLFYCYCKVV